MLSQLNSTNHTAYTSLLATLFSPTSTTSAGLNYLRLPLGATDLSASSYTYDDYTGDAVTNGGAGTLGRFSIDNSTGAGGAPGYVFDVLQDILAVAGAGRVKVHLCPWSMVSFGILQSLGWMVGWWGLGTLMMMGRIAGVDEGLEVDQWGEFRGLVC